MDPAWYTDWTDRFDGPAEVLTPRATVEAIRAGYRPLLHPSAQAPLQEGTVVSITVALWS